MRFLYTLVFTGVVASQLGSTDCGNVLADPGFDLWCGDGKLCAWKIERGNVARVPTWNEADPGVELVGTDVAIEQLTPVSSGDGTCIEFDLIANVDPDANVELHVDVLGDGTIEHTERLPNAPWQPLAYQIAIAGPYAGVRFEITKNGTGHAMLANIGAKIAYNGCSGADILVASSRPLGTPCDASQQCASGLCGYSAIEPPFQSELGFLGVQVCIGCDSAHPCTGTDVCGLGVPTGPVRAAPTTCVPAASKELGEQCAIDTECWSGFCTANVCSTCNESAGCTSPETCGPATTGTHIPWLCSPQGHLRNAGEPCETSDDCKSSACGGPLRWQCADGRACVTSDTCPFNTADSSNPLQNGACLPVGYTGGTCQ